MCATYTKTYTFSNGTTADGGQVNTEIDALGSSVNSIVNAQVASNAAISISKTELGTYTAWTAWTPTLGVTSGTFTSTTIFIARYTQIGKLVAFHLSVNGTTSTTPVDLTFTLPVTAAHSSAAYITATGRASSGGAAYTLRAYNSSATVMKVRRIDDNAWAAGAVAYDLTGLYEAA